MNNKNLKTQILELKEKGYSYNEIKNKLGCSKGTIAYHVGTNQKEKTNIRTKNSRNKVRRFLQEYKSNKCCADCGENYPYWIMEFDHIFDNKNFTIGQFSSKTVNLDIIKEEISKCEVVCSNCHKNRTFNRKIKDGSDVGWEYCNYKT
jgi:hypothetical protein